MSAAVRLSCDLPASQPGTAPRSPRGGYGWVMCSAAGQAGKLVHSVSARLCADSVAEATAAIGRLLDVVVIEHRDSCAVAS